jgi:hypothetical protein
VSGLRWIWQLSSHHESDETLGTTNQPAKSKPLKDKRRSKGKKYTHTTIVPGSGKQSLLIQQQIGTFLEAGIDPTSVRRRLKGGCSSIYVPHEALSATA